MDYQTTAGSRDVARAAIELSMTQSRDEEQRWRQTLRQQGVIGAAADFGGDFLTGIVRIVERAVVAAKREQVIGDSHLEEGGVAGAALVPTLTDLKLFGTLVYRFPTLELAVFAAALLAVWLLYSAVAVRYLHRQSLVERIKTVE